MNTTGEPARSRNAGVRETPVILSLLDLKALSKYFCFILRGSENLGLRMHFNSLTSDIIGFNPPGVVGSSHLDYPD